MKNYKEIATENSINQDNYILDIWGSFDAFREDVKSGDYITLPIECIVPRSAIEFDNAEEFQSKSDDLIELTFSKMHSDNASIKSELVIYDGHNRYKTSIAKGFKKIKCKVI